jgi:hypothetical protein
MIISVLFRKVRVVATSDEYILIFRKIQILLLILASVNRIKEGSPALPPAAFQQLLNGASGQMWEVIHIHRSDIRLRPPLRAPIDTQRLLSLLRWEGHVTAAARFRGEGPWSTGLENRNENAAFEDKKPRRVAEVAV